ncbi:MAG: glycosyltransferase family 39 protein, partial [Pseudonocardiales bacterium]
NAQGNHLLPVLLALAGSLFGVTALLQANVAIGAVVLFVFFGLARRIVGAGLALLVMSALAVSMPFVYVSRDAYSEPLMMLFLLGGLALLHRAITSRRVADYAIGGFVVACATMVRVDSYLGLLAVAFAAVVAVALAEQAQHRAAAGRAVALVAGGLVPFLLGWLDLTQLSVSYFHNLHHQITLQVLALVALIAISPAIVWLGWRPGLRRRLSSDGTRRRLSLVAVIGLFAAFAFLASRPWWQVTRRSPANPNLENMQRASGVAVDGTRLYNEQSVNWQAMYLGWPTVLLAVAGYAVLVTALVRRRSYALVGTLSTGLIVSALYLWDCQIVADQPWASRRFVPVVIPLLLVAAGAALQALWSWQRSRGWGRALAIVAGVLMVAVPLAISQPMRHVRDEAGQLNQLQAICRAVGGRGAVVEVDESSQAGYGQAIRSYCGVPTVALVGAKPAQLATMRATALAHGRTLFVLSQDPDTTDYAAHGAPAPFWSVRVPRWPNVINKAPVRAWFSTTHVFLSTVDEVGLAHAVPPAQ